MNDDVVLSARQITVKFDDHLILNHISFDVVRGSTLAIIGPNGAGKTVLFKVLLGLIPYEGTVSWAPDVRIGYVPQKLSVGRDLPLTVFEFLKFKEEDPEKIKELLQSVGFKKEQTSHIHNDLRVLQTRIGSLSGGELQRVLIAYALLGDPQVLLFDEPTSGIDIAGEETMYSLIHNIQREKNLTILFISHELEIVYKHAGNVLCLNKERICFGTPKKVINQESLFKLYGEDTHVYKHHEH
ncbi:metal ABC transporter ATP-binding protein [Candidatus Gottesmanbacteria bacterium]|nr:metal ABC transporter ATP-binding protein [Candidatus Gottesmanbacteria bacterium]